VLWPASRQGFEQSGRGAVVTDITAPVKHRGGEGHPLYYLTAQQIEQQRWAEVKRLVRSYDPTWELVAVLLKPVEKARIGSVCLAQRNKAKANPEGLNHGQAIQQTLEGAACPRSSTPPGMPSPSTSFPVMYLILERDTLPSEAMRFP
jgi:hypothetical protein